MGFWEGVKINMFDFFPHRDSFLIQILYDLLFWYNFKESMGPKVSDPTLGQNRKVDAANIIEWRCKSTERQDVCLDLTAGYL